MYQFGLERRSECWKKVNCVWDNLLRILLCAAAKQRYSALKPLLALFFGYSQQHHDYWLVDLFFILFHCVSLPDPRHTHTYTRFVRVIYIIFHLGVFSLRFFRRISYSYFSSIPCSINLEALWVFRINFLCCVSLIFMFPSFSKTNKNARIKTVAMCPLFLCLAHSVSCMETQWIWLRHTHKIANEHIERCLNDWIFFSLSKAERHTTSRHTYTHTQTNRTNIKCIIFTLALQWKTCIIIRITWFRHTATATSDDFGYCHAFSAPSFCRSVWSPWNVRHAVNTNRSFWTNLLNARVTFELQWSVGMLSRECNLSFLLAFLFFARLRPNRFGRSFIQLLVSRHMKILTWKLHKFNWIQVIMQSAHLHSDTHTDRATECEMRLSARQT